MVLLQIEGVKIIFPYVPYKSQEALMGAIIRTLNESFLKKFTTNSESEPCFFNALLESPTGTGKTMCLLCACLAWRIHFVERTGGRVQPPKIYFASRTHSQLSNAISELKKCPYTAKVSILSSREHLCIHEDLVGLKGSELNHECNVKKGRGQCSYYENLILDKEQNFNKILSDMKIDIVQDIEDLFKNGKEKGYCPFYYEKFTQENAEITFLPYNFLVSPSIRQSSKIDLFRSIVIFDEAHNLPQVLEDSMSNELSLKLIIQSVIELTTVYEIQKDENASPIEIKNTDELRQSLLELEIDISNNSENNLFHNCQKPGTWLFELLSRHNLNIKTISFACDHMSNCHTYLKNRSKSSFALQRLSQTLQILFSSKESEDILFGSFRVLISETEPFSPDENYEKYIELRKLEIDSDLPKLLRTILIRCFNPAVGMKSLITSENRPPQCIILASGTLSPISYYSQELGIPFQPRLRVENPHVIKDGQLSVFICGSSINSIPLSSDFTQRSGKSYHEEVGKSILEISKVVPSGLLVFFASYNVMNFCIASWKSTDIFNNLEKQKSIFIEPNTSKELKTFIDSYENTIKNNTNGAMMLAVCRGKVAEGLSFADNNGRCVVIVGLPFPPKEDSKVQMKQEVLDSLKLQNPTKHKLSGKDWYLQQCSLAINQSIGRVIRHRRDYAAVVLMDERFSQIQNKSSLSFWLHKHIRTPKTFNNIISDLQLFYNDVNKFIEDSTNVDQVERFDKKLSIKDSRVNNLKNLDSLPKINHNDISKENGMEPSIQSNYDKVKMQSKLQGVNFVKSVKMSLSGKDFEIFRTIIKSFESKTHQEKINAVKELRNLFSSHSNLIDGLKPFVGDYSQYLSGSKRKIENEQNIPSKNRKVIEIDDEEVSSVYSINIDENNSPSSVYIRDINEIKSIPKVGIIKENELANTSSNGWKCPICFESKDFNSSAPCGHICCDDCWSNIFKVKYECPICKQKVREKQLRKVYIQ